MTLASSRLFLQPPLLPTCLLVLFLATRSRLIHAQRKDYIVPGFQRGRVFFKSADAPLTATFATLPDAVSGTRVLLDHVERVETKLLDALNSRNIPQPDDPMQPCKDRNMDLGRSAVFAFGLRGWPEPDVACITEFFGTHLSKHDKPPYTEDDVYNALFARGDAVKKNIKSIARTVQDNITDPDFPYNYPFDTQSQRCMIHPAAAHRVGDKWYILNDIKNVPNGAQLPDFGRQSIVEYARIQDGKLNDMLRMRLQVRPENGETPTFREDATSEIGTWRGGSNPSFIQRVLIEDNPAILKSLEKSSLSIEQAQDALTPSSIAILVFPLGLTLVPIAVLAEVSTMKMLLYTLMSDVLTAIPLAIKGIELISIGTHLHRTVTVRMTSSINGTRSESATAEIYAAECRSNEHVRPVGIAFLTLSLTFMVIGIVAEVWARRYMKTRRKHRIAKLKEAESYASFPGYFPRSSFVMRNSATCAVLGHNVDLETIGESYSDMKLY